MKKINRRWIAMMLTVLMVITSLAACGGAEQTTTTPTATPVSSESSSTPESKTLEPVTLTFLLVPPVPNDLDSVISEFEKRTKDTLNVKLRLLFADWSDIGSKVAVKLAAGEELDAVFNAQWTNPTIQQNVSNGLFVNLDSYFNNDAYPGLKAAFDSKYLESNSWVGEDGKKHVYGIPFTHSFNIGTGIYYRKDLAEKYGITINKLTDIEAYWDAIKQNEKSITPFGWDGAVNNLAGAAFGWFQGMNETTPAKHNVMYGFPQIPNITGVAVKEDGTCYIPNNFIHIADPEFVKLIDENDGTKKMDPYLGYAKANEWYKKGYLEKDILSQKDARAAFKSGVFASCYSDIDTYNAIVSETQAAVPGAKVEIFIPDRVLREGIKGQMATNFIAWNFMCIPVTSKNVDRTMSFLEWMFSDRANHDLIEHGIEGKHWEAVGDDKKKIPDGVDPAKNYNLGGYALTWVPTMQRFDAAMPDEIVKLQKTLADPTFYIKDFTTGFSFNGEALASETAKCNEIVTKLIGVGNGVVDDYKGAIEKINKELEDAGVMRIREEAKKQFDAFLKENPYNGQ